MKIAAALVCGLLIGGAGVYVWILWHFRDVMK